MSPINATTGITASSMLGGRGSSGPPNRLLTSCSDIVGPVSSSRDAAAPAQAARVATRMALIVCIRFSACSKTIDAGDSKTSSVTSMQSIPNFS